MNISMRPRSNSLFSQPSYDASEDRINRRLNEEEGNVIFVQEKIMSSSWSSDQEDSLSRAKEVLAQARSQRHTSSSPRNHSKRRTGNTSYQPHSSILVSRQERKEKETAMLLEEIMLVKQKILIGMKNTKTLNADRDSCIQSFLQACDAFSRVHEHSNKSSKNKEKRSASSDRRRGSAIKEEQRKTMVKFDLSRNEIFLF